MNTYLGIQAGLAALSLQGFLVIQAGQYLPQNLWYLGFLDIQADQVHPENTNEKTKLKSLCDIDHIWIKYYL